MNQVSSKQKSEKCTIKRELPRASGRGLLSTSKWLMQICLVVRIFLSLLGQLLDGHPTTLQQEARLNWKFHREQHRAREPGSYLRAVASPMLGPRPVQHAFAGVATSA